MNKAKPRKPLTIAVVFPYYAQPAIDVARGVARFGRDSGRFIFRDVPFVSHLEIPRWLARLRADGAVLWLASVDFEEIRSQLPPGLRMVNISADRLALEIGGVCASDQGMVDLMYRHLSEAGYQRFGVVGYLDSEAVKRRLPLLRKKLARVTDVDVFDMSYRIFDETTEPESTRALERWLRGLRPPVGIIAAHAVFARCVALACRKIGRAIPQDVGILSTIDERKCVFFDPPVSAVRMDSQGLGYAAMKLLAAELRGRQPPETMVQVPPRDVIARGSAERGRPRTGHIAGAVGYIDQHAVEGIGVDDVLSNTQTISRRKFYDDFTAAVGCSPADYIRRIKIAHARDLLATTALSIKRIARSCGFQSVRRFYDAFTRNVGKTPVAFRKQQAGKKK